MLNRPRTRVFRASYPMRSGTRHVLLRVVSSNSRYTVIRLTALPGEPTLKRRQWTVAREDLDTMINTGLAKPISRLTCSTCDHPMHLFRGIRNRRTGVFFACSHCEECFEI